MVAECCRAGKSEIMKLWLLENERMISPKVEQLIWIYSAWQKEHSSELLSRISNIQFVENFPQTNIGQERLANRKKDKYAIRN